MLLFGFCVWFFFCIATMAVGVRNNRSAVGWFLLGALFGPLALMLVALFPALPTEGDEIRNAEHHLDASRVTKTCPDCAETVLAAARVCKHCGFRFEDDRISGMHLSDADLAIDQRG